MARSRRGCYPVPVAKKAAPAVKNTGRIENLTNAGRGRPPGTPNKVTREVKDLCNALIDDLEYQKKFKARFIAGELAPQLEAMVWYYAKGKPKETLQVESNSIDALAAAIAEGHKLHGKFTIKGK